MDSFEKRIFLFIFFLCLYWLWQNLWQLILFGKLFFVYDYESLFNIQAKLSSYESSVFIRIIYYVISNPTLNLLSLIRCIKLIDILAIAGIVLLIKKCRIVVVFNGIKYVWGLFWIIKALHSKSVYLVINCLKWLSLGAFLSVGMMLFFWLYQMIGDILEFGKSVHEL